jgi:hypothetical protein
VWVAALLLLGGGTLLAMLGTVLVRARVSLDRLRTNNEVAGFKFATVGVMYAVLLAFAVILVWERLEKAESDVAAEAGAAATIFRLAQGMGPDAASAVQDAMRRYLEVTVRDDWPAMERGGESPAAVEALSGLYATLLRHEPADARGTAALGAGLGQLDLLTQARRDRIAVASGIVPGVVWLLLFLGAFVTVGFTFFFGTENLRAQVLMTGALAFLIFSGLLLIVAMNRPFTGTIKVMPEPLTEVIEDFAGDGGQP